MTLTIEMLRTPTMSDADIYAAHAVELTAFATSMVGRNHAADAVSAAMVSVLSSPSWRQVTNHRAYLYRSVFNECCRLNRRSKMRATREREAWDQNGPALPNLRPEVAVQVQKLSPQQRAVIVLTYWQQMSVPQVAEHLGISEGSVKKHLARARANLREVLDA